MVELGIQAPLFPLSVMKSPTAVGIHFGSSLLDHLLSPGMVKVLADNVPGGTLESLNKWGMWLLKHYCSLSG